MGSGGVVHGGSSNLVETYLHLSRRNLGDWPPEYSYNRVVSTRTSWPIFPGQVRHPVSVHTYVYVSFGHDAIQAY